MVVRALAAAVGLALVAGCALSPDPPSMPPDGPLRDADTFAATMLGRDLVEVQGDAVLRISADGSWLERQRNHITASGRWRWEPHGWCHEGRRDGRLFGEVCAAVTRIGGTVTLTMPGLFERVFRIETPMAGTRQG